MMFPRISHLIGEQMLIHSVSDLYMTVCTCNNHNVFRVYLRHHLYHGRVDDAVTRTSRLVLQVRPAGSTLSA